MFKPTPTLNARLEARLRGWRGPATKILRQETKRTDPLALAPAFQDVPLVEPKSGLAIETAHKMMGLPIDDILEMRGQRQVVEEKDVLQHGQIPRYGAPKLEKIKLGIARQKQKIKPSHPHRPRREPRTTAYTKGLLPRIPTHGMPSLARYKPPSTTYWRHSIYTYNKHAAKDLPATTANTNKLIRAYFNMRPSERYAALLLGAQEQSTASQEETGEEQASSEEDAEKEVQEARADITNIAARFQGMTPEQRLEYPIGEVVGTWRETYKQQLVKLYAAEDMTTEDGKKALTKLMRQHEQDIKRQLKLNKTSDDKIWVSDRGYANKGLLRQDLAGKISRRMQPKTAFHYPFRKLMAAQPQITYKHYRDGVGISVHVHEGGNDESAGTDRRRGKTKKPAA